MVTYDDLMDELHSARQEQTKRQAEGWHANEQKRTWSERAEVAWEAKKRADIRLNKALDALLAWDDQQVEDVA